KTRLPAGTAARNSLGSSKGMPDRQRLLRRGLCAIPDARQFRAEETSQRGHCRAAGARLRLGVVVGVGIDVVSVHRAGGVADELDAGDLDAVGSEERLAASLQPG